ncbi:MAG: class I SAM-dependent methyltransferase [Chloroflexi bacterium]|nr:class I SAM-dependent methyltransferase [Chloroflexota bacterium]
MKGHPIFAAMYDFLNQRAERTVLGPLRARVVGGATGRVLEVGVGSGANFPYYQAAEQIVATEPDPFMLRRARRRAAELGLDVELYQCPAEMLPFPDASFDTVVSTLVLCTVVDPPRALAEVRRVLKPDGTFRFIEHVRAAGGFVARLHDCLTPIWQRVAAGCHLNRRSAESIQAAGFEIVEIGQRQLPFFPLIVGVARCRAVRR